GAGVALNCLLLYAIRRFTKTSLGTYKQLLTIFAAFDVYLTVLHAAVKPRVVIVGTTFGVVCALENRRVISFYCACFTVPFTLMSIHFLYRFWSIRHPNLIALFSSKKFAAFLAAFPIVGFTVWYLLCIYALTGEGVEAGKTLLSLESARRFGKEIREGWIMMDYWEEDSFHLRLFLAMLSFDAIMIVSFSVASTLGGLTFYYIKKADTISMQALNMQLKLFIAVCAQTFVPLVFVYIPYFCAINFPFFRLPIFLVDELCMLLTSCFPAWDAIIMIILMKDYREGLVGLVRKKKPALMETTWKTTTSMMPMPSNVS
ncbi:hypothetical protein PENTCL1PPCAC_14769, partial [Pristionchus entomophagus]